MIVVRGCVHFGVRVWHCVYYEYIFFNFWYHFWWCGGSGGGNRYRARTEPNLHPNWPKLTSVEAAIPAEPLLVATRG